MKVGTLQHGEVKLRLVRFAGCARRRRAEGVAGRARGRAESTRRPHSPTQTRAATRKTGTADPANPVDRRMKCLKRNFLLII